MTPKEREVMQMALTLLENLSEQKTVQRQYGYEVINSLRELLSKPEQEPVTTLFGSLPVYDVPQKQEPVAWMHNFIDEVVIAHRPADLDRHPDRWTPLYKDPTPCQTCKSLARTVMMDQTYHDSVMAQREWQGLTDEEILEEYRQSYGDDGNLTDIYFAHAIEAKLKEKNHG